MAKEAETPSPNLKPRPERPPPEDPKAWVREKFDAVIQRRVVYLDIGSAGGLSPMWRWMIEAGHADAIFIDMQDEWLDPRMVQAGFTTAIPSELPENGSGRITHIKAAVGNPAERRTATAHITRMPGCSSLLRPNFEFLNSYPLRAWFDVMREEEVEVERYDSLSRAHSLPDPEIVKLDVQGAEYDVLLGMGSLLDHVLCIEFETQMQPIYENQATFFELYPFMIGKGFILRDLQPQGCFEGEAIEFNSFWSRRTTDPTKRAIIESWEVIHKVWPGRYFAVIDPFARSNMNFNDE